MVGIAQISNETIAEDAVQSSILILEVIALGGIHRLQGKSDNDIVPCYWSRNFPFITILRVRIALKGTATMLLKTRQRKIIAMENTAIAIMYVVIG